MQNSQTERGAMTMVVGVLSFLVYAIVFLFRAFSGTGFELGVVSPVVGLAIALPMHYTGVFEHDWVSHLAPIYVGTLIFVVGALMALAGMMGRKPATA
jgi:hypothetical protein